MNMMQNRKKSRENKKSALIEIILSIENLPDVSKRARYYSYLIREKVPVEVLEAVCAKYGINITDLESVSSQLMSSILSTLAKEGYFIIDRGSDGIYRYVRNVQNRFGGGGDRFK